MGFFMIIPLIIFIWLVVELARRPGWYYSAPPGRYYQQPPESADTPLEILKKRYARGEIDRAEYESRKRDLVS